MSCCSKLGDLTTSRSSAVVDHEDGDNINSRDSEASSSSSGAVADNVGTMKTTSMAYSPQTILICELPHDGFEEYVPSRPAHCDLVSKWRTKDLVKINIWEDECSSGQKVKFSPCLSK
ncbi:hypothetical protein HAX54_019481 [Datura stramonium]|uniref:Uncharacterized protein n=1 Tax=Datura stramonium TaxID=4076 RepID=A0ABS8S1X8_DATST|nr:hypothetical protein [Datura stramonium]